MHMRLSVKQLVLTKILSRNLFHGNAEDCLFLNCFIYRRISRIFYFTCTHRRKEN